MTINYIENFLKNSNLECPCLVIDLSMVSDFIKNFRKFFLIIKFIMQLKQILQKKYLIV